MSLGKSPKRQPRDISDEGNSYGNISQISCFGALAWANYGLTAVMGFYWQRWRFPYERSSPWSQDTEQRRRWYEACEHAGVEQVRAQVSAAVNRGAGPPASIAIGTEQNVVLGFCQEWLTWHDRRKANRE